MASTGTSNNIGKGESVTGTGGTDKSVGDLATDSPGGKVDSVQGGIDAGKPFYLGSSPDISNYRAAWNALESSRESPSNSFL